ncbi:class I SAM-dependent methyltransferase [Sphingomonas sp.]|uniref:class I SAM-dependent methyltransferase n=1 Tax=Sphingomonas sp. TaxID=28214 RepID=UPI002E35CB0B|nr:class I SAM-dependent methyltransferase [Sphingomonas sp.]HEX4695456.1 class I SAM-dependent methyltransferase [Sphingomonas sp.]
MASADLSPAARAFDAVADVFDVRFTPWLSVAAQRRAVRDELLAAFPRGARLLEIGGGTGEDALWVADRDREVVMTDASPAMVRAAAAKFGGRPGLSARVAAAEDLTAIEGRFDGAWSNFAGLNCVADLSPVGKQLARLLQPGASAILVVFGSCCVGEMIVEAVRGRPRNVFRRFARGPVAARLGGNDFTVCYHRARGIRQAMAPWFDDAGRRGIGVFVPPSAAEPRISRHPRFLSVLEAVDEASARPLAMFGDHILYRFVRNAVPA